MMGRPNFCTWISSGVSSGTPGLTTIRSCRRKVSRPCPPASTAMPSSMRGGISFASASALRTSDTVTWAPWRRRNSAAATPALPRPTPSTFFPFISMQTRGAGQVIVPRRLYPLSQLQCSECKECKHQRENPEARDHFRLRPPQQFEVMVQGRHAEDALAAAQLVAAHLQDDRHRLEIKDPADERQQQLLLDDHSDRGQRAAQRQRAHISHEDLRRMCVVPEKANARARHGPGKDGDFTHQRHTLQLKII